MAIKDLIKDGVVKKEGNKLIINLTITNKNIFLIDHKDIDDGILEGIDTLVVLDKKIRIIDALAGKSDSNIKTIVFKEPDTVVTIRGFKEDTKIIFNKKLDIERIGNVSKTLENIVLGG